MSVAFDPRAPGDARSFGLIPAAPVFAQVGLDGASGPSPEDRPPGPETRQAQPPGGLLLLAILSALSGAIMGLVFGGYLTVAFTLFLALPVGIALGIWAARLAD